MMRTLGAALLVTAGLLAPSACTPSDEDTPVRPEPRVEVVELAFSRMPGGARFVSGKLLNTTDRDIQRVQIQVSLFDAVNRRIGSLLVPVQDIGPGQARSFRQFLDTDGDVRAVRVRRVFVL